MEIANMKTMVAYIQSCTPENAAKAITEYGNQRFEQGSNGAWKISISMWRKALKRREKRIRNHLLDFNDEQSMIDIVNFVRFFSCVEDELKKMSEQGGSDVKEACASVNNLMYNKLAKIKPDRRLNFTDNGWEAFARNDEEAEEEKMVIRSQNRVQNTTFGYL